MAREASRKKVIVHKINLYQFGHCRQSLGLRCRHEFFKAKLALQDLGGYADRNSLEGRSSSDRC